MRKIILLLLVFLAAPAGGFGQAAGYSSDTGVAKEVFATIAKWGEAVRARNTKTLDEIFEDNVVITADGHRCLTTFPRELITVG